MARRKKAKTELASSESAGSESVPPETTPEVALTRYQKFQTMRLHRRLLNPATYNPRTIDASSRRQLKKSLQRNGLVELLVWNKRTGTLVSGHQRLSLIDELEGGEDYEIEVAVIDVDPVRERELNVSLNNEQLSGSFDLDKLAEMVNTTEGIDLDALGFSQGDLRALFPERLDPEGVFHVNQDLEAELEKIQGTRDGARAARAETPQATGSAVGGDAAGDSGDDSGEDDGSETEASTEGEGARLSPEEQRAIMLAKIKEAKHAHKHDREGDKAAYVSFVFGDHAELLRFLQAADLPDQAVQDGRTLAQRMGMDLDKLEAHSA